jgi:hypothetical protein
MSYRNLEIWEASRQLVIDVHAMTLKKLPKFELFEEGAQTTLYEIRQIHDSGRIWKATLQAGIYKISDLCLGFL